MNPFQKIDNIKLNFVAENSDRQKEFGFNGKLSNFKAFTCYIPLILPDTFVKDFMALFNKDKKNDINLIIEKNEENKYKIMTSNKNVGFHKFLINCCVRYLRDNFKTIFERPQSKSQPPQYFQQNLFKEDERIIKEEILKGECEASFICNFFKNIKYNSPKAHYLSFIFKDESYKTKYFDLNMISEISDEKNDKFIFQEACDLFDSLYDYEKEITPEFYVTIDTPKDPRIHELMSSFTRFRDSIDYEFTDELWKDFLLAIGDFGIARIVSGNHLTDFVNILQDHIDTISVQYDIEKSLFKMRQKTIKKIYKFMNYIYETKSENFQIFINTVLNSSDNNEKFLIKRGKFCISANNLLNKIDNEYKDLSNSDLKKKINKFIGNNRHYFSDYQRDESTSFKFVQLIQSKIPSSLE